MAECNQESFKFPALNSHQTRRKIEVNFSGGEVTSDGGVMLLREMDRKLGLTKDLAKHLNDPRNPFLIEHTSLEMLRQRVYGLCLGYEDLNDQQTLRNDTAIQTAIEKDSQLASPPTLCRFENRGDRATAILFHQVLIEKFMASFKSAPTELILDFDATDDIIHGNQVGRHFHGYYENYCFLPLYVFCEDQLLVSYLRPSNIDGAKHSWAIMSLLVKRLRKEWPAVKITFRGDSGFCRHQMLTWFEKNKVQYIMGIAGNKVLERQCKDLIVKAKEDFEKTGTKQKLFSETIYAAKTWSKTRHVIVKSEHTSLGANTRYIVTNLEGESQSLYENDYCARGEMENRIKEQQLDMFADRTSCHKWWPNQFRLLLSSVAYVLMESMRRLELQATELAKAQVGTIRLKLLKIGAVVVQNTRRIKLFFSSHYPYQELFKKIALQLISTA